MARLGAHRLLPSALALALLVLVLALPDLAAVLREPQSVTAYHGRITAIESQPQPLPGGGGFGPDATVLLLDGPQAGQTTGAYLVGPGGTEEIASFHVGDDVVVTFTPQPGGAPFVAVQDHWRLPQLGLLVLLFAAAVILVGGWRGARALLALGITIAVIVRIVLPLVVEGAPPVPLAVAAATAVTFLTILLTEGWSRASVAAILGTSAALALTGLLGAAASNLARFTTAGAAELAYLSTSPGGQGIDLSGLLLAALILGSLGILEDVTMTQAAVVQEVAEHRQTGLGELYARGITVGRTHIAATVNTLFLAYVGISLPLLVLLLVNRQPGELILNSEVLAVEVVRTLVGSIGIVAAVPLTTAVAAILIGHDRLPKGVEPPWLRALLRPGPALGLGLMAVAAVTLLAAGIVGPLGTARQAQPTPGPLAVFPAGSPSPSPASASSPPSTASSPESLPPLYGRGEAIVVVDGGVEYGTVAVKDVRRTSDAGTVRLAVLVEYVAEASWTIDPTAWALLDPSGQTFGAGASSNAPSLGAASLAPGEHREGWIELDVPTASADGFLTFSGSNGDTLFAVTLD